MKENKLTLPELEKLLGTKEITLFYLTWLKHNRNATQAYLELHPDVTEGSARVLGSRMLAKVNIEAIAASYGLDHQSYFEQLVKGLVANKQNQYTGEIVEDHQTRKAYHDKLGAILRIENQANQTNIQVNIPTFNVMSEEAKIQLEKLYEGSDSTND